MAAVWSWLVSTSLAATVPIGRAGFGAFGWLVNSLNDFLENHGRVAAEAFIVLSLWIALPLLLICACYHRCAERPEEEGEEGKKE